VQTNHGVSCYILSSFSLFFVCLCYLTRYLCSRQHQLRVHLQLLGFSICNDTLYGGICDAAIGKKRKQTSLTALSNAVANDKSIENVDIGMTKEAIRAAKDTCLVCQGKASDAFSSSQLLVSGHSINLHAFNYRITFAKKKQQQEVVGIENIEVVECKIDHLPAWTEPFQHESIQKAYYLR